MQRYLRHVPSFEEWSATRTRYRLASNNNVHNCTAPPRDSQSEITDQKATHTPRLARMMIYARKLQTTPKATTS